MGFLGLCVIDSQQIETKEYKIFSNSDFDSFVEWLPVTAEGFVQGPGFA